jgi:hypothetical protein
MARQKTPESRLNVAVKHVAAMFLAALVNLHLFPSMVMVGRATAAAIREAYVKRGEERAIVVLRRHFAIENDEAARQAAKTIASWPPFPPGRHARRYHIPLSPHTKGPIPTD